MAENGQSSAAVCGGWRQNPTQNRVKTEEGETEQPEREEGQAPANLAATAASRCPSWVATEGRELAAGDRRRREEAEKEEAGEGGGFHGARAEKAKEAEESLI